MWGTVHVRSCASVTSAAPGTLRFLNHMDALALTIAAAPAGVFLHKTGNVHTELEILSYCRILSNFTVSSVDPMLCGKRVVKHQSVTTVTFESGPWTYQRQRHQVPTTSGRAHAGADLIPSCQRLELRRTFVVSGFERRRGVLLPEVGPGGACGMHGGGQARDIQSAFFPRDRMQQVSWVPACCRCLRIRTGLSRKALSWLRNRQPWDGL